LFGGEIGTAFMQTFVRRREQFHSNIIGQHVAAGTGVTADRLAAYAARLRVHAADTGLLDGQAHQLLASAITAQANVLAYQDGFMAAAAGSVLCLVLVALMRPGRPAAF
jgi:DHA2 family multidrug resistance protein